jgi:hypothetical protein
MPPFPDTEETLREKILRCVADYSGHGIFCLPDGKKAFSFIHGDWSLANSRGAEFCGVNSEVRVLRECGCYADFTFPSLGAAQPRMINRIYYCKDEPSRPKSYNWGRELTAGGREWGDLLMIPGIIGLRWTSRTHRFRPSIESSNLDHRDTPVERRVDYWVKNAVTVRGKPEWKFIKLHSHGAVESAWNTVFGAAAERMYRHLEQNYNDGKRYVLHYVSAREMYNIAKAAEANEDGSPNAYRDYRVGRYVYLP